MCGVVGYSGNGGQAAREAFVALCREAAIRGVHAFGIAYIEAGALRVFKSNDLTELLEAIPTDLPRKIIFHNRYATSGDHHDHRNNQPIVIGEDALVFNGTIDMGTKEEMELRHGLTLTTENDGELVLQDIIHGRGFIERISDSRVSFAGIYLSGNGTMIALRNFNRPLWCVKHAAGTFVVSTRDIALRANLGKITTEQLTALRPLLL